MSTGNARCCAFVPNREVNVLHITDDNRPWAQESAPRLEAAASTLEGIAANLRDLDAEQANALEVAAVTVRTVWEDFDMALRTSTPGGG